MVVVVMVMTLVVVVLQSVLLKVGDRGQEVVDGI